MSSYPNNSCGNKLGAPEQQERLIALESENTRLKRQLAMAQRRARQSGQSASAFLSAIGHEIRMQMNALFGFTQLLGYAESETERDEYARNILECGEALLKIVESASDCSESLQSPAAWSESEVAPTDIRKVVSAAVESLRSSAIEQGIDISFDVDKSFPRALECDGSRLREIVRRMVRSAVNAARQGLMTVRLSASEEARGEWSVLLETQARRKPSTDGAQPVMEAPDMDLAICKAQASQLPGTVRRRRIEGRATAYSLKIKACAPGARTG